MIIDIVLGLAGGKGGLENVLTTITQALQAKGHDVRVFQIMPSPYQEWEESLPKVFYYDYVRNHYGKGYEAEIEPLRYALGYRTLLDIIGVPDLILATHTPLFSFVTKMAVGYLGNSRPPIISWIHGPTAAYGGGELLKFADAHLAISASVGQDIKNTLTGDWPIFTINNPVSVDQLNTIQRINDHLHLIYVGRIDNKQKRLDIMFQALAQVKGSWELHLYGEGADEAILKSLANQLSIAEKLNWHGWLDHPWEAIDAATLLILTSDYEGFGLVLVEALARGVPVIATNCEGPKDIIKDGENGWLFPTGDYNRLAELLQNLIDKQLTLPAPEQCVQSVQQYTIDSVIKKMEQGMLSTLAFYNP